MSFETNQKRRTLEANLCQLKWKISRYHKYLDVSTREKSKLMIERLERRLNDYVKEHDQIWEQICIMQAQSSS